MPLFNRPTPDRWHAAAERHGYRILGRVIDRLHLAIGCLTCNGTFRCRVSVLIHHRPICPHCRERTRRATAGNAGVIYLGASDDPHYGRFRLACGHDARRQYALIDRVAQGKTGLRCHTCKTAQDVEAARRVGWELLGPDPDGRLGYRLYKHGCGQIQSVARANLMTRRFTCGKCSLAWSARQSSVYVVRFRLPDGLRVIKLGHSGDPISRIRFQLARHPEIEADLLRNVPFRTGREAMIRERSLHRDIRRKYSGAVLPVEAFQPALRVRSEVYAAWAEPAILRMVDGLADPN